MTTLDDALPNDEPFDDGSFDPETFDCGHPHDGVNCSGTAPRRGLACTRADGHAGPHCACGSWECKYLVWRDGGGVLYDSRAERLEEMKDQ